MITISKKHLLTICVACTLLTGCIFGDPSAVRIVSIDLVKSGEQSNLEFSANDKEVREALEYVDAVLVTNGFTRAPQSQTPNSDGTIVFYESATTRGCGVSLQNNTLKVMFMEFSRRRSTDPVKKICVQLAGELKRHYGAKKVKISTN